MTIATQSHIRDTITLGATAFTGIGAWADKIGAIPGVPPNWAHYWPFVLIGTIAFRAAMAAALRVYNVWYPPEPSAVKMPPQDPVLQQTGNALK